MFQALFIMPFYHSWEGVYMSSNLHKDFAHSREPTIVTPFAELVHEVIPQGSSLNKDVEPIQWVKIQSCSYGKYGSVQARSEKFPIGGGGNCPDCPSPYLRGWFRGGILNKCLKIFA
jgi:hypothetical protein